MEIRATIDRFEGEMAILILEDNNKVIWPKNKLPDNTKEGSVVIINIVNNQSASASKKEEAKNILNEILNTNKET